MGAAIEKVSIIVSKGSLEGIYPALIMANGARAEGIDANLFFTFFGLDAVTKKRHEHVKVATVGNPGLHLATIVGALPGASAARCGRSRARYSRASARHSSECVVGCLSANNAATSRLSARHGLSASNHSYKCSAQALPSRVIAPH